MTVPVPPTGSAPGVRARYGPGRATILGTTDVRTDRKDFPWRVDS